MERIQRTVGELLGDATWPELPSTATVAAAQDAMARDKVDCVLVVDDGKLVGVFTSRDFLDEIAAPVRVPSEVVLADVMTPNPESLKRQHCVTHAINRMAVRGFRNLPIVDEDNRPVGLLRVWDVIEHLADVFEDLRSVPPEIPNDDVWVDLGGG
jgi:CBS domain-containing protein